MNHKPGVDYDVGSRVEVGHSKFAFKGIIIQKRTVTVYDVKYDDGDIGSGISYDLLKLIKGDETTNTNGNNKIQEKKNESKEVNDVLKVGTKVMAKLNANSSYYPGIISRKKKCATYDVVYEDGEKEFDVTSDMIINENDLSNDIESRHGNNEVDNGDTSPRTSSLKAGRKVEVKPKGKDYFISAIIINKKMGVTYDIDFDSGDSGSGLPSKYVYQIEAPAGIASQANDFNVNDKVDVRFRGKVRYFPGKISKVNTDGTYDITYDDGEQEMNVVKEYIRPSTNHPVTSKQDIVLGTKVEARYRGKVNYYPGIISKVRLNGTYDINYDDGEKETCVEKELIRILPTPDVVNTGIPEYQIGDKIEACYQGKTKWYSAVISSSNLDGTYNIQYADGENEISVIPKFIRSLNTPSKPTGTDLTTENDNVDSDAQLLVGTKIESRYKGKSKYYPGVITRVRLNGTYDIDYDDGEKEFAVTKEMIRRVSTAATGSSAAARRFSDRSSSTPNTPSKENTETNNNPDDDSTPFSVEDKVEARYKGKVKYYPGIITRARLNGTYDIDYDDGEKEIGVVKDLIKLIKSKSTIKESDEEAMSVGSKVEARYKGKVKYYPGVITRARLNGTYDIDYDDGEKESGVAKDLIREISTASKSPRRFSDRSSSTPNTPSKENTETNNPDDDSTPFSVGDKVEARYKGKVKYYPGIISKVRLNGTYDIDYDDGEKEIGVVKDLIKLIKSKSTIKESDEEAMSVGSKVEARYKGKVKYYPGVISRARLNGTYDIDYDDGEKETCVEKELIRLVAAAASQPASSPERRSNNTKPEDNEENAFTVGSKVEARYKGKVKYYPGVITRARLNGTYDIDYDDGEKETGVAKDLIREISTASKSPRRFSDRSSSTPNTPSKGNTETNNPDDDSTPFLVGDKVEARYKGKVKYYPGIISRVRLNGTYDIDYDDGEKEIGVAKDLIREISTANKSPRRFSDRSSSTPNTPSKGITESTTNPDDDSTPFLVGDKVEARYKGKVKYYPGIITRVRLNGTYDIDYDDGEKEIGVAKDLIKLIKSKSTTKESDEEAMSVGSKVEARYKGKSKYYPGVITRARLNGTYDIDYDDGEKETGVAKDLIRLKVTAASINISADDGSTPFLVGDKVEARYKGKVKYYPGIITRVRLNGTYDIDYDDGEKEIGALKEHIRLVKSSSSQVASSSFKAGDKVEARYRGRERYFPAVIQRIDAEGTTYSITYDDGEEESGVSEELIRIVTPSRASAPSPSHQPSNNPNTPSKDNIALNPEDNEENAFTVGSKVEARYKGKVKYYPGVITRVRLNGTYDIDYDDGEKESGVAKDLIREISTASKSPRRFSDRSSSTPNTPSKENTESTNNPDDGSTPFSVEDKVEARYKGKVKYYPGIISRVRLNGTYDIDYDDGEKEIGVAKDLIRVKGNVSPSKAINHKFEIGNNVKVKSLDSPGYQTGTIFAAYGNNTYDVVYDDGKVEKGVESQRCVLDNKSSSNQVEESSDENLSEGTLIEARFRGRAKWFKGKILRVLDNGKYNVRYDDGETEINVSRELIRIVSSEPMVTADYSAGDKRDGADADGEVGKSLEIGSKVEARQDGRARFHKGVVTKKNADGSYEIELDDGEIRTDVARRLIRLLSSRPTSSQSQSQYGADRSSSSASGHSPSKVNLTTNVSEAKGSNETSLDGESTIKLGLAGSGFALAKAQREEK